MFFLTDQDVRDLLSVNVAIEVVEKAFLEIGRGNVRISTRQATEIQPYGGLMLSMPAYVGGEMNALGQKVVTIYPSNPNENNLPTVIGMVQLLDPKSGECLVIMEASALTALRTGAASAVATKYLATENSDTIGLFGAGVQAEAQLEAICLVRKISQIKVYAPTREHVLNFCKAVGRRLGAEMSAAASPREVLEGSDIIVCATTSQTPIFDGELLDAGMHINCVGSHTVRGRELDTISIQRSKLIVDSRDATLAEAGDVIIPISEGAISIGHIWAELGEIVAGKKRARTSEDEITLFKSVGLAVQDIASAKVIYERAIREQKGRAIDPK